MFREGMGSALVQAWILWAVGKSSIHTCCHTLIKQGLFDLAHLKRTCSSMLNGTRSDARSLSHSAQRVSQVLEQRQTQAHFPFRTGQYNSLGCGSFHCTLRRHFPGATDIVSDRQLRCPCVFGAEHGSHFSIAPLMQRNSPCFKFTCAVEGDLST